MNNYQSVIGLEIHVELKTNAKMFCRCPADYFGKPPNSQTCPVCLGLPGALPVPNKKAIEYTHLIGRALNCHLNEVSKFDRKHYFYPDLPKGYQISQYDEPFASQGNLHFSFFNFQTRKIEKKAVRIQRVHLEEDTGKLIHKDNETLIDFNRSGVPLVEIVTEPDFTSSDDVKQFLEELQVIIRYLQVADADMEKGSMRLEPNISVKNKINNNLPRQKSLCRGLPNYKVEVKNINSFRFVKQAIDYEVKRQIEILEKGETPAQETRGFDENKSVTYSQRTKEEAHDYRYFPEPDIPPMIFDPDLLSKIELPELPQQKIDRYMEKDIKYQDAFILTRDKNMCKKYEESVRELLTLKGFKKNDNPVSIRSIQRQRNQWQIVANLMINSKVSSLSARDIALKAVKSSSTHIADPGKLVKVISTVMNNNQKAVTDYKKGKQNSIMFLVGQVMKEMKGQADPQIIRKKLEEIIHKQ